MTEAENIRAWCIDRAIAIQSLHVQTRTTPPEDIVSLASRINLFIVEGDPGPETVH